MTLFSFLSLPQSFSCYFMLPCTQMSTDNYITGHFIICLHHKCIHWDFTSDSDKLKHFWCAIKLANIRKDRRILYKKSNRVTHIIKDRILDILVLSVTRYETRQSVCGALQKGLWENSVCILEYWVRICSRRCEGGR